MTRLPIIAAVVFGVSFSMRTEEPTRDKPTVYTMAQAAAGRMEMQTNSFGACADCHTTTLTGRNGDIGELPPLSSLPDDLQKTIRNAGGKVPPLAGENFMTKWGARTTKDLSSDMRRRFNDLSEETQLNIMAYILQANGALPGTQALTRATDVEIRTLTTGVVSR
jgi:cytochrome c553